MKTSGKPTREERKRMVRRDLFWLALVILVFVGISTLTNYLTPPVGIA